MLATVPTRPSMSLERRREVPASHTSSVLTLDDRSPTTNTVDTTMRSRARVRARVAAVRTRGIRQPRTAAQVSDIAALIVPGALAFFLLTRYPTWVANRSSLGQYFNGVYRSRVLARETILGIANAVDAVAGAKGTHALPGFTAGWEIVTVGGFLATCWLLRSYRREHAVSIGPIEVVIAALMVISASVLTPYDFLADALIVATVVAARSGRALAAAVLVATAVATRESGLLAVAVIAAACLTTRGADGELSRRRYRAFWCAALSGVATYVTLKLVFRQAGTVTIFQHVAVASNLSGSALWGIAVAVALVLIERWAIGPLRPEERRRRRVLWALALPYLAVLFVGAIWSEAPRLVMPLVIGETLLVLESRSTREGRLLFSGVDAHRCAPPDGIE
jgi:hypothetical protein